MILEKREKFRSQMRKKDLEKKYADIRLPYIQRGEMTPMVQKFELLIQNNHLDLNELHAAIPLFESTTNEELIVLILRYVDKVDLKQLPLCIPEMLLNKLATTRIFRLQFYLIASITNLLTQGDNQIQCIFAQRNLMLAIVEVLHDVQEIDIIPNLLECIAIWPYEFFQKNKTQDKIELLISLQPFSEFDIHYFYKILIKLTEEINTEPQMFQVLITNNFIQNAIDDFNNKQYYIVDFFNNLSFLDNDYLNPIINFNFLSAIVFELNKPNKIQSSLYLLIRNLLLTDYSIRMLFYNFSIFQHLCYGIEYSIENMDLNSLEEILTCLKILFLEEEMGYANHRKSILDSETEREIQQIFQCSFLQNSKIFTLAAELLTLFYSHFPFNGNQEFVAKINQICNLIDTEIYLALMKSIVYYEQ